MGSKVECEVSVPSGVRLEERHESGTAHVAVRAPDGSLLLEFEPASGVCRVRAPRVEVSAGEELRLNGRSVQIEGSRAVTLRSGNTAVALRPEGLGLLSEAIDASSTRIEWTAKKLRVAGDLVECEARRLTQRVGELETHAQRVLERAAESFREVEGLAQTKAGRLRLIAEDTFRAVGRRTFLKAREDLKVRGERIYLE